MAPRRAQSATGDNRVPNQVPPPSACVEELRDEFRRFQEVVLQRLEALTPPPPPAGNHGPRGEELPPPPTALPTAGDYLPIIRELRAMHTPRFEGLLNPNAAEEWLLRFMQDLEEEFERKYYRRKDEERRLSEFLYLQQGNRTVREYEAEFVRLLNYAAHLVPREHPKIQKFVTGLRPSHRWRVTLHEFWTLGHCIEQLEKAEEAEKEERDSMFRDRSPPKRHHYTRRAGKTGQAGSSSRVQDKGKTPAVQALPPPPPGGPLICYRCDQPGHIAIRCPARTTGPPAQADRPPRSLARTGAAPRVYALGTEQEIPEEEEAQPEEAEVAAIACTLHHYGVACYTLFDTGATHSFLDTRVAERLEGGEIEPMKDFIVRVPFGETLTVCGILRDVPLEVCGRLLTADLIVVPIRGFDVILGMDWLMKYQAYIDCPQRTIWFATDLGGFEFRGRGARATNPMI
ncbi:PREDICTED: uncharacterized protein LOC104807119 [Tarenaya hassleriana]|uniref:uncharacterized protein LOC104807119 n=1 Tax=Tarenaya hassleriana TaxID=28532 RepID=UPI00053C1AE4|nr:PREDICTED: uncharacterized protein LOC104807119 [Tarenaya hassleriana]